MAYMRVGGPTGPHLLKLSRMLIIEPKPEGDEDAVPSITGGLAGNAMAHIGRQARHQPLR